jgi:hypothetical protein
LLLIVANFAIHADSQFRWCTDGESELLCARNWLSAGGNLLTFIAAGVAAVFAYGHFQAARAQANFAVLPSLEERIDAIENVVGAIREAILSARRIRECVEQAPSDSTEIVNQCAGTIYVQTDAAKRAISIIKDNIPKIRDFAASRFATVAQFAVIELDYCTADLQESSYKILNPTKDQGPSSRIAYRMQFTRLIRNANVERLRVIETELIKDCERLDIERKQLVNLRTEILDYQHTP